MLSSTETKRKYNLRKKGESDDFFNMQARKMQFVCRRDFCTRIIKISRTTTLLRVFR